MSIGKRVLFMMITLIAFLCFSTPCFAQENVAENKWENVKDAIYPILYSEKDAKKLGELAISKGGEPPIFKPALGNLMVAYIMIRQEDRVFILRSHLKNLGLPNGIDEVHAAALQNLRNLFSKKDSPFIIDDNRKDGLDSLTIRPKQGARWQARLVPSLLILEKELFSLVDASIGKLFAEHTYYALPLRKAILIVSASEMRLGVLEYITGKIRSDGKSQILISESFYEVSSSGVSLFKNLHQEE